MKKSFKQVKDLGSEWEYQLNHFHGSWFDFAFKVTQFIELEVDKELGKHLYEVAKKIDQKEKEK